jgi:FSR family fosmidomycin resistance protein-like MFS transporter
MEQLSTAAARVQGAESDIARRSSELHGDVTAFSILFAISGAHLINDMIQALLPALYPDLKHSLHLTFSQIGLVTLVYQMTASLLQPLAGLYADKNPRPYILPLGTLFTLSALPLLAFTQSYGGLLLSAALLGMSSSIFHPESSRVARMASGGRLGLAQALFQVGGNFGTALGPLAAAVIVVRWGRISSAGFTLLVLLSTSVLWRVASWYRAEGLRRLQAFRKRTQIDVGLSRSAVTKSIAILLLLVFSKYFYMATMINYYTFYLMEHFKVSVQAAQVHLFVFLGAVALGTVVGGQLGDKYGRKRVIWFSILGALPFTLLLPHVDLFWTGPLSFVIGFILASAFPAIVVFAQELMPNRVGMVAGLFFGFMFGVSGLAAAVVGHEADVYGIEYVFVLCGFLPILGVVAGFLPNRRRVDSQPQSHEPK